MAQVVSRWTFTAEDLVRAQVSPCENCVGEIGAGTGFSPSYTVSPANIIPPWPSLLVHYHLED
jgi:hypothetical protein